MDFKPLQSKSLAYPGDVDAICLQGHLTKCRLFEWVALWNRMAFSFKKWKMNTVGVDSSSQTLK